MHSFIAAYELNKHLIHAVESEDYENTLELLVKGARPTLLSPCGRTAVGSAAFVGNVSILQLLMESCENPDLDIFACANSNDIELDTTPDGMDNLEWEDEFEKSSSDNNNSVSPAFDDNEELSELYYYYAKTFEQTGAILNSVKEFCSELGHAVHQDPHTLDADHMTPLHYAALCGHYDCTRLLLEHDAPVNAVNTDGITPLHLAAKHSDITRLLLKHGANPALKTIETGETALHVAIKHRCTAVAHILLQTDININETDDLDQTPLIYAIAYHMDNIVHLLIDRGARLNLLDSNGHNALYHAVTQRNIPIATRLLEHGSRRVPSHYLLHECVRNNWRQMAELLINHGESLNVRNKQGLVPITLAIISQAPDMLEYLLQVARIHSLAGKYVDRVDNELIVAVQFADSVEVFKPIARLIYAYGDANNSLISPTSSLPYCYVPYCQTPLARAIMLNKLDIAEFLIKEGVDITQLCKEHVVNGLRFMGLTGYAPLAKLLVHAGFQFPFSRTPLPDEWRPERKLFESEMRDLCSKPLSLQSLCRITIRTHLTTLLQTSPIIQSKYCATKEQSSLSRMLRELGIPRILQTFLIDFNDCETVMNNKCEGSRNYADTSSANESQYKFN